VDQSISGIGGCCDRESPITADYVRFSRRSVQNATYGRGVRALFRAAFVPKWGDSGKVRLSVFFMGQACRPPVNLPGRDADFGSYSHVVRASRGLCKRLRRFARLRVPMCHGAHRRRDERVPSVVAAWRLRGRARAGKPVADCALVVPAGPRGGRW
jgi:hypothetical protein